MSMIVQILEANAIRHLAPDVTAPAVYALAAGTSDVNSASVDTNADGGSRSLAILLTLGAIAATGGGTAKLQHSDDNATWTDVQGSAQSFVTADADKSIGWDVTTVTKRYYRVALTRLDAANSAVAGLFAFLSGGRRTPVVQQTTAGQFVRKPVSIYGPKTGVA